jgi:hypothetical protein
MSDESFSSLLSFFTMADAIEIPFEIETVEKVWELVLKLTKADIKPEANLYAVVEGKATKLTDDILKHCDDAFLVPQGTFASVIYYKDELIMCWPRFGRVCLRVQRENFP